ncbi:MAG: biotin/lipoate A/B protein ligase family protein [Microbacteriaceae bacterium]
MPHAEYKIPGGKLVVVDFEVHEGLIANFSLSGDFFLEPDSALEQINAAVNGLESTTPLRDISSAITRSIPAETVLFGISAEGVATAIRRALGNAANWRDYDWQIVHPGPLAPKVHLALDQVLTEEIGAGRRKPTLRFWEWEESAVVLGSFQSVKNEVDAENAKKYGIEIVRRISGGGAMFMEAGAVITYSLYLPDELVQGMSFADSYAFLDEWTLIALNKLGIEASYKPLNDITSPKGKIGGAAQKRLGNGGVLHHVTMSYDMDGERMVEVLRIGREKISDKGITSAVKRVDPLKSQTGKSRAEIIEVMKQTFIELYGATESEIRPEELMEAEVLAAGKFSDPEWINRVP